MSNEIEDSLVETLSSSELSGIVIDVGDAMSTGLPVFGSLKKLWDGTHALHTHYYAKKVAAFLKGVSDVSQEQRQQQIAKMTVVPGEKEKFAEHLAMMIDRMNEIEKAKMMGKVARAYLREEICLDDLKSLNFALDAVDLRLTDILQRAYENEWGPQYVECQLLVQCGLMYAKLDIETERLSLGVVTSLESFSSRSEDYETFKSARLKYMITDLGRLFVEICLK